MPAQLAPVRGLDPNLDRVQIAMQGALAALVRQFVGTSTLRENIALTTSDTRVAHNLGYAPKGYIVVKSSADEVVYDGATAAPDPARSINLRASGTVTVSLLFF